MDTPGDVRNASLVLLSSTLPDRHQRLAVAVKLWSGAERHGRRHARWQHLGSLTECRKTSKLTPLELGQTAERVDSTHTVLRRSRRTPKPRPTTGEDPAQVVTSGQDLQLSESFEGETEPGPD
jgi:hypothetical protein